jgi:ABC-type transporter Mla subunit MlaD
LDSLNTAQNQLKQATDNARAAVMQTTNQIQGQVDQASAQIDRFGSGVVQASQVLSESLQPPVPPVMTASATLPNFPPSPPSGSIGDSGATPTVIDPNAQWRKPTPR